MSKDVEYVPGWIDGWYTKPEMFSSVVVQNGRTNGATPEAIHVTALTVEQGSYEQPPTFLMGSGYIRCRAWKRLEVEESICIEDEAYA